jgi:hypothetical protein
MANYQNLCFSTNLILFKNNVLPLRTNLVYKISFNLNSSTFFTILDKFESEDIQICYPKVATLFTKSILIPSLAMRTIKKINFFKARF